MKVYTDKIYSYAHIVEINKSEIGKIDLAICKQPRETLGNFYKRQTVKPNVLINAGFFSMKNGETIFNVVDEGKEVSNHPSYKWGLGITSDHKTLKYGSIADKSNNFIDFVTGYPPLVDNGKSCAPWKFANENCGKRWWEIGWMMLIPTFVVQIPFYGKSDDSIGILSLILGGIECCILLISILPTEKALKKTFDNDGIRK